MIKIAASVLVFAPAAPLLYLLGGTALLIGFFVEKLALVSLYRRPRAVDECVAERCRLFLIAISSLHVIMSCLFYSERAYSTGSDWTFVTMRPFTYAFALWTLYLVTELAGGDKAAVSTAIFTQYLCAPLLLTLTLSAALLALVQF